MLSAIIYIFSEVLHNPYGEYSAIGPGRPQMQNSHENHGNGGYGYYMNSPVARKAMIAKLSRYDMLLGVVKAEAFFSFSGDDVQYGIEADRRTRILRTFVKNTYR